jgi:hypothetical protein
LASTYINISSFRVHVEGSGISLCILSSLNGSIFSIDILRGKGDNPINWILKGYEKGIAILSLSPNLCQWRESTRYRSDGGYSISLSGDEERV